MDANLTQRKQSLEEKIPDIKKTLEMVKFLHEKRVSLLLSILIWIYAAATDVEQQEGKSKSSEDDLDDEDNLEEESDDKPKPLKTTFELNDTLYAEAEIEDTDTVFLWLGVSPNDVGWL